MKKILLFLLITVTGCEAVKNNNKPSSTPPQTTSTPASVPAAPISLDFSGQPTMVYKTKNDYYDHVPVILSDDKTQIVSYPAPQDVYYQGRLAYPKRLNDNYLLDNRGIDTNVAFLKWTYEAYSKLQQAPPLQALYSAIIDKEPLLQLCNCGNRQQFKNEVSDLNILILNQLTACKKLK
jgi:hypothetical protein